MPRRRYRLLTVCAVVIVILLYRVVQNSWESDQQQPVPASLRPPQSHNPVPTAASPDPQEPSRDEPLRDATSAGPVGDDKSKSDHVGQGKAADDERVGATVPGGKESGDGAGSHSRPSAHDSSKDKVEFSQAKAGDEEPLRWKDPSKDSTVELPPTASKIHWAKPEERFPVPRESIIPLPTRGTKKLPKIQYDFRPESKQAKAKRSERQKRVKAELERSWAGYRKYAWMHDELSPVSGGHRDPFCGWAATLVDSLDTLWIAGLKDEFDEAAKAAKEIDFTYTNRHDIPVFETTIRYLGGLIAAFDVSGGAQGSYAFLLDKAVELAEILMGIFDTPNRMPVLYYQWKPEFTSQPHLAGRVGIAELATLSMEFTRLAQLTAQHKYYDAIDRITNALVDMQKQGTLVPGLFPESLDASGCNRTATSIRDSLSQAAKDQVDSQELLGEPQGFGGAPKRLNSILDSNRQKENPSFTSDGLQRRAVGSSDSLNDAQADPTKNRGPYAANGQRAEWDCVPQGLVPNSNGAQKFHLGGGQDSAYEYFPKEYLLLGGRESKYQKLYEDAIDAVNERLLFQPMVPGDWDVLLPSRGSTTPTSSTGLDLEYEITHLTCFVGGMYGLGGKLFGRDKDVEMAKKLTDACVWAYQSTQSGIMPEYGQVIPCRSLAKCEFNETLWWEKLDPAKNSRDEQVREWEAAQEEQKRLQKTRVVIAGTLKQSEDGKVETLDKSAGSTSKESNKPSGEKSNVIDKRGVVPAHDQTKTSGHKDEHEGSELPQSLRDKLGKKFDGKDFKTKTTDRPESLGANTLSTDDVVTTTEGSSSPALPPSIPKQQGEGSMASGNPIGQRPLSHEEYVKDRIERSGLPPGFVSAFSPRYILRPEAIESVWYLYRITGDPSWMDKGWDMFQATVRATRTAIANSAVANVLQKEPALEDEMESFWMAETLKYYYLLFSEPDVISLDEWVLNTEAHPFKL